MRIVVVGGGRMGLPLACVLGKHGADVCVADVDAELVSKIADGQCPYEEPGLAHLMGELRALGNLSATTNTSEATASADAVIVIVPAHLTPEREIDFRILRDASADVGRSLQRGALVVYETTVSVGGTRRHLLPVLEEHSGLKAGSDFMVGYSPERVKANLVLQRLESTPKVVGGIDAQSLARTAAMYRQYLRCPIDEVGTLEAAEMTKLVGMLYRDVNIALANELAAFCELAGVEFDRVCASANSDGEAHLLHPGIGVGGHCTPVYPYFLTRESRRLGFAQRISEAAREINDQQPARQLARVERVWRPLRHQTVHILGLGFRPGVKVDTFSPAYDLRTELLRLGAEVTISDPWYSPLELRDLGFAVGVPERAKVVVLNTAHEEFAAPSFSAWRSTGVEVVLDGRNLWQQSDIESAGLLYLGIGRSGRGEKGREC